MNANDFIKKIYTVAFRLTGDEVKAANMADVAIKSALSGLKLSDKVPINMLKYTAKEVCKIFLLESKDNVIFKRFELNNKAESLQNLLMSLNPLSRAMIVWRDVLGFKIDEIVETEYSKQQLYFELNDARRQIKEYYNVSFQKGIG